MKTLSEKKIEELKTLFINSENNTLKIEIDKLMDKFPENLFLWNIKGMNQTSLSDYNGAIESFLKCVKFKVIANDFDSIDKLYSNVAFAYLNLKNNKKAIENFKLSLKYEKNSLKNLMCLSDIYSSEKKYDDSILYLQKALNIDKNNIEIIIQIGKILLLKGENEEAKKFIKRAEIIDPNNIDIKYILANFYINSDNLKEAEKIYLSIIKSDKSNYIAHNDLGALYVKLGDFDNALLNLNTSVEINPDNHIAWANLGNLYIKKKLFNDAIEVLIWSLGIEPDHVPSIRNIAKAYLQKGDFILSKKYYHQLIALEEGNPKYLTEFGEMLFSSNEFIEAEKYFLKATKIDNEYPLAYLALGHLYSVTNNQENAIKYLNKASNYDSTSSMSNFILGEIYKNNKFYTKAIEYYSASNYESSKESIAQCMYFEKKYDEFISFYNINKEEFNASRTISSIINHANKTINNSLQHPFCPDPFSYIKSENLTHKLKDIDKMNENLVKEIKNLDNSKRQLFIKNGKQSEGNLFTFGIEIFDHLQNILLDEYHDYLDSFSKSNDIFITQWPNLPKIMGWFVTMKKGGYVEPHNHVGAWLSGVYYLKCPEKIKDSGNLEFSFKDKHFPDSTEALPKKIVETNESNIVLFPSSLFHRSLPYETDEERICIAFDFMP